MPAFLAVPWLNELLLLSPTLLLTFTGKSRRPLFLELPGDLVLPLAGPHSSGPLSRGGQKIWGGARLPWGQALLQGLHWRWISGFAAL